MQTHEKNEKLIEDERLTALKGEEAVELDKVAETYDNAMADSQKYYDERIKATDDWAARQSALQQEQSDFAISEMEKKKIDVEEEAKKEQAGAYQDWKKETNRYGVNSEEMASQGLSRTGYAESSQVRMFNAYQNRVAVSHKAAEAAKAELDVGIAQARLQNNAAIAEIYFKAYEDRVRLSLEGFQYNNELLFKKTSAEETIRKRYQDERNKILDMIYKENSLEESARQFNITEERKKSENEESTRQWEAEMKRLIENDEFDKALKLAQLGLDEKGVEDTDDLVIEEDLVVEDGEPTQSIFDLKRYPENPFTKQVEATVPQIHTKYYSGDIAENVGGFGYMGKDENGNAYQPKGVEIDGEAYRLEKTGLQVGIAVPGIPHKNTSGVNISLQNLWKATTNNNETHYFVWNGTKNAYEEVDPYEWVKEGKSSPVDGVTESIADAVSSGVSNVAKGVKSAAANAKDESVSEVSDLLDEINKYIAPIKEQVANTGSKTLKTYKEALTGILSLIKRR